MANITQIKCINRTERMNPHERIKIESGESAFVVQAARRRVNVIVAVSPSRQKYLKTEIDGDQPDTLLRLRECP